MGFVRLLNSQILGKIKDFNRFQISKNFVIINLFFFCKDTVCDPSIRVRFFFILLGPKNDSIDYLEIGRCVGTLMTNKVNQHLIDFSLLLFFF